MATIENLGLKILTLDIETSPHVADVWSLWNNNVSLNQLRETGRVICFAAKWYGRKGVEYRSDHHDGHEAMVARAWEMIDEADIVVGWNSQNFDIKHLEREFIKAGLGPPSPHKNLDLLKTVRQRFRFASNKLDHVAQELGVGKKLSHTGHDLWVRCMAGDPKAWALMKRYNIQDVVLTENVYDVLRPWIPTHPHVAPSVGGELACNRCGSDDLAPRGFYVAYSRRYRRYRCNSCGGWMKGGASALVATLTGVR